MAETIAAVEEQERSLVLARFDLRDRPRAVEAWTTLSRCTTRRCMTWSGVVHPKSRVCAPV